MNYNLNNFFDESVTEEHVDVEMVDESETDNINVEPHEFQFVHYTWVTQVLIVYQKMMTKLAY